MIKKYLTILSGLFSLSACTGSAPKNQDKAADSAQQAVVTEAQQPVSSETAALQVEEEPEEVEPQEEIVLDNVLALLAKQNIGGAAHKNIWKEAVEDTTKVTRNYTQLVREEGEGAHTVYEVGAFKNPDGTYQVVVFDNSGLDMYCTHKTWSYVFDGEKLKANKVSLPKPKFMDMLDPVCYFGVTDQNLVNKLKTGTINDYLQYNFKDGKLLVNAYLEDELIDQGVNYDWNDMFYNLGVALYDWNGQKFVYTANQPKQVINYKGIGSLRFGSKYKGEPIDGYEVKAAGAAFEVWKNGEKYFTINTNDGAIQSFDVFTSKLSTFNDMNVGDNLKKFFDDFELLGNIVKNGQTWTIEAYPSLHIVVNASDVISVEQINAESKKITFKKKAKVKQMRIMR